MRRLAQEEALCLSFGVNPSVLVPTLGHGVGQQTVDFV